MKKYIYHLFMLLLATATMTSCAEDEGTDPGNDPTPAVIVYQYKPVKPFNSDNDIVLRFATNNKTTEAYYLAEKAADKKAHITSMGEDGYMDYVISKGTKINDISGESNVDITLTGMYGEYIITAVAVGGSAKSASEATFIGLDWKDVVSGTYHFFIAEKLGVAPTSPTILQVCTTNANLYRFKDVFGKDAHMKINLIDIKGKDAEGEYQFFRVPPTETTFTFGTHGIVSVRDIGYFQNNDAFVTEGGYESGMYANHDCFIYVQYYVPAGNLGYDYDYFIAD